ncbi:helix-turn-helix domain-containing protein [Hydrogenophaga sp. T2]|uniref:helix-turn-helix transcriptional regulator n=1 Tax=Hydrogenophaga sp. T2 TaxID=3132823 RepID=UPI003CEAF88D
MPERLFLRLPDDPPCAPGTTVPASTLRGFALPAPLRSVVTHVTAYEERFAPGAEVVERVIPDGASRVLVLLQGGAAAVHVAGASVSPVVLSMRGHMHGLSIMLEPGASMALWGVPADELAGRTVPWSDLSPRARRDLPEQLAAAADDTTRVGVILAALCAMHRPVDLGSRQWVAHAAGRLQAHAGGISVRALAAELGLSERRLQQLFAAQIGLAPSAWRRLQRLHGTLRLLRMTQTPQWAQIALEHGYYDQSHMINEFRVLCGLTPPQFLRRVVSDSSNTAGEPAD